MNASLRLCLAAFLVSVALETGCSSYWENRWVDMRDVVCAYGGLGYTLDVGVEITPVLPVGVGGTVGPQGYAEASGIFGRVTAAKVKYIAIDIPMSFPGSLICLARNGNLQYESSVQYVPFFLGGTLYDVEFPGINQRRWGRVGLHGGLVLLHGGAYFEVFEFIDFLGGFAGLDISQDDVAEAK